MIPLCIQHTGEPLDAWLEEQLCAHHFFPRSRKYLAEDITLSDGTVLHKGDHVANDYGTWPVKVVAGSTGLLHSTARPA